MKVHPFRKNTAGGFSLIEMITVTVIIAILAVAAVPLAQNAIQREREIELRRCLREIRTAIDAYKKFVADNKIDFDEDTYGYPEKLEKLVAGINYKDKNGKTRIAKFLRRIPYDPVANTDRWGLRSYQDKLDSSRWGGQNIWDIYCTSTRKSLDGTFYSTW